MRGKFPLKIPPHNLQRLKHRLGGDLMILQQHNQIDGQLDLIGCIFQLTGQTFYDAFNVIQRLTAADDASFQRANLAHQ